jgi:hypothetical protein
MVFVSDSQSPEVLRPGKKPFNLPPASVTSELSAILSPRFLSAFTMRRNHLNATFVKKLLVKVVAVVSLISNKLVGSVRSKAAVYGVLNQCHLVGRSTFLVSGDRKTSSVCDGHDLGALATFCLADSKTPFFAGTKLPSMNASRMSIPPRLYRSSASSWTTRRKTPWRTHCWNRRWHVWCGGYRCGISFQGAPVRNIHKMPSKTSRGSRGRRPRGSLSRLDDVMMGSIRFHCSFVSSILIILHNQNVTSSFFLR